jgi:S-formylglutathione hydrolase FrmB
VIFNAFLAGNLIIETIDSRLLSDNPLGDSAQRKIPVYLPPGYHKKTKVYPSVYILSGLFGSSAGWLSFRAFDENLVQLVDRNIRSGNLPPFVMIFPDCSTKFGGSQYLDSPGTGLYMSHLCSELIPYMQSHYNLGQDRNSRAVVGKSSGGFGAIRLGMAHPELFGHVASSAGDLHFDMACRPELAKFPSCITRKNGTDEFLRGLPELRKLDSDSATILNIFALSSCYSSCKNSRYGFQIPINSVSGELDEAIFNRWLANDPVVRISESQTKGGKEALIETGWDCAQMELESLGGLDSLYLESGNRDEYHADLGARVFANRLQTAGVGLEYREFDGGHFGTTWRYEMILKHVLERIP